MGRVNISNRSRVIKLVFNYIKEKEDEKEIICNNRNDGTEPDGTDALIVQPACTEE